VAEPLGSTIGVALRLASLASLEALAHLLEAMRASIDPATTPAEIRRCLKAVRQVVQQTETVEGLEPATPDDDPPNEVQAHVMLRIVELQADLTKALGDGRHFRREGWRS
jgi:hypothetical protein